jgi:drug/metabolite transporter (DMT)-like permease
MKATNFNQTLPYAFLTLSTLFWGGNLIVGKLLVLNISPILLTQIRWILTAAFLFLIYHKKIIQNWGNIKSSFVILCLLSLCGQVFFPLNLYIALQYTNPINAAIYLSASPCLVIIINKLVFKDFVTVKSLFGIIISTFGVVYLIIKGDFFNLRQFFNLNIGDFWAMGSALSWSIYCSFLRLKNKNISGNVFVTVSAIIASVFLIPILFFYQFDLSFIQSSFSLYAFIGRVTPWPDPFNPPPPTQDQYSIKETFKNIIAAKKIISSDISSVVPRKDWATGTVYDYYDDRVNMFAVDANNLVSKNFYIKNRYEL